LEKFVVNIPSQHFASNLTEAYSLAPEREETLKDRIAFLDQVIEADVLECTG